MADVPEQIEKAIRDHHLLQAGEPLLVAVSGGLDSMVLLYLLRLLSKEHGWHLHVAHFNHLLRGKSSNADEAFVKGVASRLGVPFFVDRADVRQFTAAGNLSLEMAARELRHKFLAKVARKQRIAKIALAHQADDQVELFFLRLLRGTSLDGLSGMQRSSPSPADARIQLIRPLLECPKSNLRDYARDQKIAFRDDATNESLDILRNRIRHELLPLLQAQYQPAIARTTLRLMEIIRAESELIEEIASSPPLGGEGRGEESRFSQLALALQRRLIQRQLIELGLLPNFEFIESLRRSEAPVMIRPGTVVVRDPLGHLRIEDLSRARFDFDSLVVALVGREGTFCFKDVSIQWQVALPESSALRVLSLVGSGKVEGEGRGRAGLFSPASARAEGAETFDAEKIGDSIVLRHWQPGDRFQPIGMSHAVKLQDLFVNQKVLRPMRHKLLIAATANDEIVWVEGLRISEQFKLDKQTKKLLKWRWRRG